MLPVLVAALAALSGQVDKLPAALPTPPPNPVLASPAPQVVPKQRPPRSKVITRRKPRLHGSQGVMAEVQYEAIEGHVWEALRHCEAGGDYTKNTGNGFYGAYQFLQSTWNSVARRIGRPDLVGIRPHEAPPADQDMMAQANQQISRGGFRSQWPDCSRRLGLR